MSKFAKYAWTVLVVNIFVILWGAYVRATGSGAGCGSHWPLCNGEIIPRTPQADTVVEFIHRLTSGFALLLVLGLFIYARRKLGTNHPARRSALWSLIFIVIESLIGAGLVLFELVADNESISRVVFISVHLINTFLLLGSIGLTAWWASGGEAIQLNKNPILVAVLAFGILCVIVLGVSGAITALGDTLFPVESLKEGIQQDFSSTAHFLIRLRVWHPIIAIFTSLYLGSSAVLIAMFQEDRKVRLLAWCLVVLVVVQLLVGVINLFLLAPIPVQIIHLLLADLVWIALILFAASALKKDLEQGK